MGSCVFWGVRWPWVDLCPCEDCFSASKMEMIVISCSHLSPWPWNNPGCFNLLKNCCMLLAIGVFHGRFSDSNRLPILWMSFSKVSMMTNDCMSLEFSGDPVVRTQYFHCCGPRLMIRKLRSRKQHVMARKRPVELKWNHTVYWDSSFSNTLSLIYWYFNHFFFSFWRENVLYFGCQQRWGRAIVLSLSCVQLLWPQGL